MSSAISARWANDSNRIDIRNVVIIALPGSVPAFDRQLRVAGEDGGSSKAFFIVDAKGTRDFAIQTRSRNACRRDIRNLLNEVFSKGGADSTVDLKLDDLSLKLDMQLKDIEDTFTVLRDELGLIELGVYEYTDCRYAYLDGLKVSLEKNPSWVDNLIAAHSTKSGKWYNIRLRSAEMRATGLHYSQVVSRLRKLAGCGHIRNYPYGGVVTVRILHRPSSGCGTDSIEAIEERIYAKTLRKMEDRIQSRRHVVELFTKNRCTTVGLAEHFGAELPGGQTRCERCDWCLTGKPLVLCSEVDEVRVNPRLVKAVLEAVPDRNNPRLLARVAMGLHSPLVWHRVLHKSPVFRSMRDVNFDVSPFSLYHLHQIGVAYIS